jgi:WD40 repeat protein
MHRPLLATGKVMLRRLIVSLSLCLMQVKCIEFHPMQPWLAIADKGGNVSVWDLKTEQLVYESTVGTPDDVAMQDALLQRAAEKEPDYFGPQLSQVHCRDATAGHLSSCSAGAWSGCVQL